MSQSGLVYIDGADWQKWKADMDRIKGVCGSAADKTLAYIGAEGRRLIGQAEKSQQFEFQQIQTKWKNGKEESKVRSRMDSSHGWYKTSIGTRMIGFSYENALTYQNRKMKKMGSTVSQGYVYSLMANLWNNPTKPYKKASPTFSRGDEPKGRWGRGSVRDARPALSASVVEKGVAKAIGRAEQALEQMIREEGL